MREMAGARQNREKKRKKRNTKSVSESEETDRYSKDGMQPQRPLSNSFFINFWNLGN